MKKIVLLFATAFVTQSLIAEEHKVHSDHAHKHSLDCGHAAEWHIDHFDYNHDGHDHHEHAGEVHEATIEIHKDHKHAHSMSCGYTEAE